MKENNFERYKSVIFLPIILLISLFATNYYMYLYMFILLIYTPIKERYSYTNPINYIPTDDIKFDYILYLISYTHILIMCLGFYKVLTYNVIDLKLITMVISLGLHNSSIGITTAHELGHRKNKVDQILANTLLYLSSYMHFSIEHYKNHHVNVATDADTATARYGENIYSFFIRHLITSNISAWKLEFSRMKRIGKFYFSLHNHMVQFTLLNVGTLYLIHMFFGLTGLTCYLTINLLSLFLFVIITYIEHYGLKRKIVGGKLEKISEKHSWNTNNSSSRKALFELPRHSDHHLHIERKYQNLESIPNSPELPYGYMTMTLISLLPSLWFRIMNHKVLYYNSLN
jgi:alkane 1-monooxygenase